MWQSVSVSTVCVSACLSGCVTVSACLFGCASHNKRIPQFKGQGFTERARAREREIGKSTWISAEQQMNLCVCVQRGLLMHVKRPVGCKGGGGEGRAADQGRPRQNLQIVHNMQHAHNTHTHTCNTHTHTHTHTQTQTPALSLSLLG